MKKARSIREFDFPLGVSMDFGYFNSQFYGHGRLSQLALIGLLATAIERQPALTTGCTSCNVQSISCVTDSRSHDAFLQHSDILATSSDI